MLSQQYTALLAELIDGSSGWASLAKYQNQDVQLQLMELVASNAAADSASAAQSLPAVPMPAKNTGPTPAALKRLAARCIARNKLHEAIKDTVRTVVSQ